MKQYFQYVIDNYLQYIRITKEVFIHVLFLIAFIVGLITFMPEIFLPIFNRAFETSLVIAIAVAITVFIAFVGLFIYKTHDEYKDDKLEKSPYKYNDTDEENDAIEDD